MEWNYKKTLKHSPIKVGDYVLPAVNKSTTGPKEGKLRPNWEGPYKVDSKTGKGSYKLKTMEEVELPNHWNIQHLKKFYF